MLAVAEGPVDAAAADARLEESPYTVDDLRRLGLVKSADGRVSLAFSFLTAADQLRIATVAREHARDLADRILANRTALEAEVATLTTDGAKGRRLLYFVIGCMALDWDALAFTEVTGYRAKPAVTGNGFAYTPWMKENAPGAPRRGLYWGSHNADAGGYTFTTFGDHHALPRRALPDLAFRGETPFDLRDLAKIMVSLRDDPANARKSTGPDAEPMLAFLKTIGYVRDADGFPSLDLTVLTEADATQVHAIRRTVAHQVAEWHAARHDTLRDSLHDLTPLRQGVPFAVVYTEIWHYVFGYTNLYLSQAGLIADPYAPDAPFEGFLPFLWASSLAR
jgi:hypothetical protein